MGEESSLQLTKRDGCVSQRIPGITLSSQSVSSSEFPGIVLGAQWDTHGTWPVVACQEEPFARRGLTGWSKTIPGPGNAYRETTTGSLALTPCLPAVFSRSSCLDCSPHTPRTSLPAGHQGRFNWWWRRGADGTLRKPRTAELQETDCQAWFSPTTK